LGLLGLFAVATLAALFPLRSFRMPSPAEIDRRIEAANRLEHAPVRTQSDTLSPASQGPFAQALWREHQRRMAERLDNLAGDLPRPRVPERDPWALRAIAPLLLFIAFSCLSGSLGSNLTDPFRSHALPQRVPLRLDVTLTPPAYTPKPLQFLT